MNEKPSDFGGLCFSRVVIVGANGAGKTWLAQRIAQWRGLPGISKDALALTTGWAQRDRAEVQAKVLDAVAAEAWVLEGGPSILLPEVLTRANLVVWLDFPAGLRFRRILWRSLRYLGRVRPEHPPGNRDWPGFRQWRFAWDAIHKDDAFRSAIAAGLANTNVAIIRLTTPAEVTHFLDQIA
ncbi:hypothetical protein ACJ5NV_05030 [Loktanella agnita]|uniref:hypothetical protein n=1 Tax=Loktanella agnita TaxID=287097 RepID=UPI00398629CA